MIVLVVGRAQTKKIKNFINNSIILIKFYIKLKFFIIFLNKLYLCKS